MALANQSERKCFTFFWVLKNADFCWQDRKERIESTSFIVEELEETRWKLWLYPKGISTENVALFLIRYVDMTGSEYVELEYDLAFLNSDREVLKTTGIVKASFHKNQFSMECATVMQLNEFGNELRELMSDKTIQIRCRIWKCEGEFSNDMTCTSLNRLSVERTQTVWKIEQFSSLDTEREYVHEIRSVQTGKRLLSLDLMTCELNSGRFKCKVTPWKQDAKSGKLTLEVQVNSDELRSRSIVVKSYFLIRPGIIYTFETPPQFMIRLMENKQGFLPNDILSIQFNTEFCYGVVLEEHIFNRGMSPLRNTSNAEDNPCSTSFSSLDVESMDALRKLNPLQNDFAPENNLSLSSHDSNPEEYDDFLNLLRHFGFMWNNPTHSDINLKTKDRLYPAHKCVLSARSPVFRTRFSNVPREKIDDCINVEDLDGSTVLKMLMYIYSGFVGQLEWDVAFGLYEAAARYKLLALKDVCSSYLKKHLCLDNAFETCLLAAQNRDDDLKDFVKDFISSRPPSTPSGWKSLFRRSVKRFRRDTCAAKTTSSTDSTSDLTEEQEVALKNACIEDFRSMLECGIHSDVKLRTSDGTYPAHKCVLSARSPVFETMLSNHPRQEDCLDIAGLDGGTVCRMLRYIYTGEVGELGWDSATGLYKAASNYALPYLKHVCLSYLKEHLSQYNLHETLQLVHLHRDVDLANFVLRFIEKITEEFQTRKKQEEIVCLILEVEKLNIFLKDHSD